MALGDWFRSAGPCLQVDEPQTWVQLVSAWGDTIAKLESEEFGPTLRFPLAMALPFEPQVAGWIRWIERRINVPERYLSLFVAKDAAGGNGHLTVVARDIVPEDFLLLTSLGGTLNYVDDLCALAEAPAGGPSAGASMASDVHAPETWAEFVDPAATA